MMKRFTSCAIWLRMPSCISSAGAVLLYDMPKIPHHLQSQCRSELSPYGKTLCYYNIYDILMNYYLYQPEIRINIYLSKLNKLEFTLWKK